MKPLKDPSDGAPTAVELRNAIMARRTTAEAVAQAAIARIAAREPDVHAWEVFAPELALAQARRVDAALAAGGAASGAGLLAGVPIAVKDILDTADLPTAYGSPIYRGAQPAADAACVALARAAGAVVMGKTVTTEFAYFSPGPTANPWNLRHTPGGSSSGSAAAVASGMVPIAFGTQTAGSLIRPASYCGIFALKPTFGTVDLRGAKRFSPSLDTLGWLARSAEDLELMRCAMTGDDYVPLDIPKPASLRIGFCRTHEWPLVDEGGKQAWAQARQLAEAAGVQCRDVDMPASLAGLLEAQKTVMAHEAAVSLDAEYKGHASQLSPAIAALLETGRDITRQAVDEAHRLANVGREQVALLMEGLDALVVPSASGEAPEGLAATGDPAFCRVWTLLGLPCVNVPGLMGPTGLPIGMQVVGWARGERALVGMGGCLGGVWR